jgi:signal transduction histidine kinase
VRSAPKGIVDDVLFLSKMDANMIEITPVNSNPKDLVGKGLGLFNSEFRANHTSMNIRFEESYHRQDIGWIHLDPSRLLQVLINLPTNALKFTVTETEERQILVTVGTSQELPWEHRDANGGLTYPSNARDMEDSTARPG